MLAEPSGGTIGTRVVPPRARGPLGAHIRSALRGTTPPTGLLRSAHTALARLRRPTDVLTDDDVQVALYTLQELSYGGFDGVADDLEWDTDVVGVRRELERAVVRAVRGVTSTEVQDAVARCREDLTENRVAAVLFEIADRERGPSPAAELDRHGTIGQFREFLTHRSVYLLKEADPHTFAIPRLTGRPKAALIEIQSDEYGGGDPDRMHSALFATTMRAAGLSDGPGGYVDDVPAITLAGLTTVSAFGLNRSLRGAVAGHLAALEMTSSGPNRRYGRAARRLGLPQEAALYFDEHVEADAVHEQIAGRDLAGALAVAEPDLLPDIVFGAVACHELDARWGEHVLAAWTRGRSSLRTTPGGGSVSVSAC